MLTLTFGSSMESHISHLIASLFSSRPKGFNSKNIDKYLALNDLKHNGYNLFEIYKKSYNPSEKITLKSSAFSPIVENSSSSNIEIIDNGKSTAPMYSTLKNYCHGISI